MKEQYKRILETEYRGVAIYQRIKDGEFTMSKAYEGLEYKNTKQKIMIVGRAMNGWEEDFSKFNDSEEMIDFALGKSFDFNDVTNPNLDCNYKYIRSKFWKLTKFLLEEYGEANEKWYDSDANMNWNQKIVWTNIYKISPQKSGNPPWKIMIQNIDEYITILKKEIEKYAPERILFITDNSYLEPDIKKETFLKAFNIKKCELEDIVGIGEYESKKIIVCRRPDRRGMSDATIYKMAEKIKETFEK